MTPFTHLPEELKDMPHDALVGHIVWLYAYIKQIKEELRNARIRN